MTEQKKRNQYEYDKKAYDHIHLQIPKGKKEALQEIAAQRSVSLNKLIKSALEEYTGIDL